MSRLDSGLSAYRCSLSFKVNSVNNDTTSEGKLHTFSHKGVASFAFTELETTAANLSSGIRGTIFVNPKVLKLTKLQRTFQ